MKKDRYEVHCLHVHMDYRERKLEEVQDDGWEIAGDIVCDPDRIGNIYFYIPLKRKIERD